MVEFVSVPVLIEKGADAPVTPFAALKVPVTPGGRIATTLNVRSLATEGVVGDVTRILGVPPLQIVGLLFEATSVGVGSTITSTICAGPLAQPPLNLGVIVYVTVLNKDVLLVNVPVLMANGAVAPVTPLPAASVPVTPTGKLTVTSNVIVDEALGVVGLVI